jgi:hypothetical protein
MVFPTNHKIIEFFDVSIVVLAKNESQVHSFLLYNQLYFQRNGIEIILIYSLADDDTVKKWIEDFPVLNKVIIQVGPNAKFHEQITAAISRSKRQYIFFMEGNECFQTDCLYEFRFLLSHFESISQFPITCLRNDFERSAVPAPSFFMINRKYADVPCETVVNLEAYKTALIQQSAKRSIKLPSLYVLESNASFLADPPAVPAYNGNDPQTKKPSCKFDFQKDFRYEGLKKELSGFVASELSDPLIATKNFEIVFLVQVCNEATHTVEFLEHLDAIGDGIILLDDGSSDQTYELARSQKLLFKVKKQRGLSFDDLGNRNTLLRLASFIRCKWLVFVDADERFDQRFCNLRELAMMDDIDTVSFRLVHLWDHISRFRVDIPEGQNGIIKRYRMYRNHGFLQITSDRDLHFRVTPFKRKTYQAPVLLLHHGLIDKELRAYKYGRYIKQDPQATKQNFSYDYLVDGKGSFSEVTDISLYQLIKRK